jgi:chemotaxis protein methyltransferase WspC
MSGVGFGQLLKDAIGLDAASIGASAIERAVQTRQAACRVATAEAYMELVRGSVAELQELIEAVVVPETWFFRDREAFATLAREAAGEWSRRHADGGVLRVLSVPCATGEEPYSIAMALIESGLAPDRFRVEAVDISERALAHARRGVYGRSSFRGADVAFRDRFFTPAADGHHLADSVRRQVVFRHGNLLAPVFAPESDGYDVIFCRNLLIYFDRATQEAAIAALTGMLSPHGFLFVGASETGVLVNYGFASAKLPMAFAFRKTAALRREPPPEAVGSRPARRPALKAVPPARRVVQPSVARPDDIADAQQLADQGRFVEAAAVCDTHIRTHGPSAAAFYLLGLVRDASGNAADAETSYRKALYLDPNHRHALAHLALLMDRAGRRPEALVLRNRVRRIELTNKS